MKDVMTYKGFIGSVHYAAEDRVFYGKVEGISHLISFEGRAVDELEKGFHYMVDEHIKDCKEKEIPLQKSYIGNLNIRLSPELHKKAALNAALKGISLNQYINDAIRKELHASEPDLDEGYTQE
ncbi:MAG: type II toxin-antitoxin system HicB family antitoxin [Candidatus Bathyarchaeota archaeon]|nr:type II toxin-antitoxin system HicB family antitoxin [Candidatus Bathyarchaeota archaeon]